MQLRANVFIYQATDFLGAVAVSPPPIREGGVHESEG